MNSHQRRKARRLYERAFGTHVDYYMTVHVGAAHPCEHDGCTSKATREYEYPVFESVEGKTVVATAWICNEHVADEGFCINCGGFWAGVESYDFSRIKGVCENCIHEFDDDSENEFDDGDDWDEYPESWYDAKSPISDLEPKETPRTRFIGEGSEFADGDDNEPGELPY